MGDALKARGFICLNIETWLLFAPPIKISGYAPDVKYMLSVWLWEFLT